MLRSWYKCPGTGFMVGHLRKLVLRVGSNIPTGVMPGPSWLALRVTVLACGPGEALFRADVLPQLSSVPSEAGAWCRADLASPACSEAPCGAGLGLQGWRRASPRWGCRYCLCPRTAPVSSHHSHQDVLHILIKVPPWAGRASDRWLSAEWQGCSGVKHGIRR